MKIIDAINRVDELKPNNYDENLKAEWLKELEGRIVEEVLKNYEGVMPYAGLCQTPGSTNLQNQLIVQSPYDTMYVSWLSYKIDNANGEIGRANNSLAEFMAVWSDYKRWYNKHHKHKTTYITYY